ncbi:hypothetical protein BGX34_011768 [Mortierella sp. NVP85]|nr:hypothetical protein BGX34_011768 [Mortierella sp. NVP85]
MFHPYESREIELKFKGFLLSRARAILRCAPSSRQLKNAMRTYLDDIGIKLASPLIMRVRRPGAIWFSLTPWSSGIQSVYRFNRPLKDDPASFFMRQSGEGSPSAQSTQWYFI